MSERETLPPRRHPLPPTGRGPNGRPVCRWCRTEIPAGSRRTSWCSAKCVNEYRLRSDPSFIRRQVFRRDRGVCAGCGIDTERVKRIRRLLWSRRHRWASPGETPWWSADRALARWSAFIVWAAEKVAQQAGQLTAHLWEADHIVPVAEGGGDRGLENFRTLCKRCHARETGALRRRLNRARSPQLPLAVAKEPAA